MGALSPFVAAPAHAQQTVTMVSNFGQTADTSAGLSSSNDCYQAQGFGMSDGGARDYRIGWRLNSAVRGDSRFEVNLDATRREPANDNGPPEHGVMLRSLIRW